MSGPLVSLHIHMHFFGGGEKWKRYILIEEKVPGLTHFLTLNYVGRLMSKELLSQ